MEKETALKILRKHHDQALFSVRTALETLIPELAESEDERIRKALVEMVHNNTSDELWVAYNVHKEDAIAWLEKQGEQKQKEYSLEELELKNSNYAKDNVQ